MTIELSMVSRRPLTYHYSVACHSFAGRVKPVLTFDKRDC